MKDLYVNSIDIIHNLHTRLIISNTFKLIHGEN